MVLIGHWSEEDWSDEDKHKVSKYGEMTKLINTPDEKSAKEVLILTRKKSFM